MNTVGFFQEGDACVPFREIRYLLPEESLAASLPFAPIRNSSGIIQVCFYFATI